MVQDYELKLKPHKKMLDLNKNFLKVNALAYYKAMFILLHNWDNFPERGGQLGATTFGQTNTAKI